MLDLYTIPSTVWIGLIWSEMENDNPGFLWEHLIVFNSSFDLHFETISAVNLFLIINMELNCIGKSGHLFLFVLALS